jgi:uncharacterized membrane protein
MFRGLDEQALAKNGTAKSPLSALTVALLVSITVLAIALAYLSASNESYIRALVSGNLTGENPPFVSGGVVYNVIFAWLTAATDVLYVLGGGVILFGAVLVIVRFFKIKLKDPYQPSGVTRYFSGYLTLSLALFIGAEIIRTTVTRTFNDLEVLILIILSRGLFSFILYLERRWHGSGTETE